MLTFRIRVIALFCSDRIAAEITLEVIVGKSDRGDVIIAAHLCKGCTLCIAACPSQVLVQGTVLNRQGYYSVTYKGSGCAGCGICFYVCPEPGAITIRVLKADKDKPAT
jgi:NAD-dependent dihydropyrimidine dehydrogenase PreA subunit